MIGVSEKMVAALEDNSDLYAACNDCRNGGRINEIGFNNPVEVAQSVIDAAWTKFDIADESTWPKHDGMSLVECTRFVNPHIAMFHAGIWRCLDYQSSPKITVTYYTDIQILRRNVN